MTLSGLSEHQLQQRLCGDGLRLRTGPVSFCIRSAVPEVVRGLSALYGNQAVEGAEQFADFHVSIEPASGLRRWLRPQLYFRIDGVSPFAPLPRNQGMPMLEWGMNWCISGSCHQYLILHAAVLERHGCALVMPAPSGSGKSTLCAALLFNGWRLLSDELALIATDTGHLVPLPRPVSLKNASINVIQRFVGDALSFGSIVRDTVKGTVGHFAPPADAVLRAAERAAPGWVIFPRYVAGASAEFSALSRGRTLMRLIENAFNYNLHREAGFEVLADLVERSICREFSYSSLDEAVQMFDRLAAEHQPGGRRP